MESRARHNAALNVLGEGIWGFQVGLVATATVLVLLLRHFRAGERTVGCVGAIEGGLVLVFQMLGPRLFHRRTGLKRALVRWHLCVILPPYALIAACAFWGWRLPPDLVIGLILAAFAVFMAGIGVILAVWLDWLARLFPVAMRGRAFGYGWAASALAGSAGSLISGWAIGRFQAPQIYGWLYGAAWVVGTASILTFLFMADPQDAVSENSELAGKEPPSLLELRRLALATLSDRTTRSILFSRLLVVAGFSFAPFTALYFLSPAGGSLGASTVVAAGAAATAGAALGHLVFGTLGDRHGHRRGAILGAMAQVACLAALLTWPGLAGCVITCFCSGLAGAALFLSYTNLFLESCPHKDTSAHLAAVNIVSGVAGLICPVAAGMFAARYGLPMLFKAALTLSLLAAAVVLFVLRDPRHPPRSLEPSVFPN